MLEHLSSEQIAKKLGDEIIAAPAITFALDAQSALRLVGLLQLACRHPRTLPSDVVLVRALADQVKAVGPTMAEVINWGWDATKDEPGPEDTRSNRE